MRILILGAGAIGGYYGGRLAAAGRDVSFLVRPARAKTLAEKDLAIASPNGDVTVRAKTVTRDGLAAGYDLVVLSCKAYDLPDAIEAVRPAVGPDTTILPLLNGLAHLETLDAAFGAGKVIGGCAHISVTLAKDKTIRHFAKLDSLTFGERAGGTSPRCEAIAKAFAGTGFKSVPSDAVMQVMWEKFSLITAASGLTGAMRAPIGAIVATRDGLRLSREMIAECEAVAAAAGVPVRAQAHIWRPACSPRPGRRSRLRCCATSKAARRSSASTCRATCSAAPKRSACRRRCSSWPIATSRPIATGERRDDAADQCDAVALRPQGAHRAR